MNEHDASAEPHDVDPVSDTALPAADRAHDLDSDEGFEHLEPVVLTLSLLRGLIGWTIWAGIAAIGTLILMLRDPLPGWIWLWPALWLVFAMLLVLPTILVPRWRHQRTRYRVDRLGLQIRRGLLWRSRHFVPRSRIQHTDVGQGPIEGRLGLAHLTVYTAGTHEASTTLGGIRYERALAIRKELTLGAGDEGDGV